MNFQFFFSSPESPACPSPPPPSYTQMKRQGHTETWRPPFKAAFKITPHFHLPPPGEEEQHSTIVLWNYISSHTLISSSLWPSLPLCFLPFLPTAPTNDCFSLTFLLILTIMCVLKQPKKVYVKQRRQSQRLKPYWNVYV